MASSQALQLLLGFGFVLVAMAAKLDADALQHSSTDSHHPLPPCATWCVCKNGAASELQKTLDYACGHGADCNPIKPSGACYNPDSVRAHCSYAVNSYFQKMNKAGATCDFSSTATLTAYDPSSSGCSYPASASSAGSATPVTTVPSTTPKTPRTSPVSTTPISGNTPTTSSPYTTTPTPPIGGLGGFGPGMGPPGMGMYDEGEAGVITLPRTSIALCAVVAGLMFHSWN